MRRLVLAVLATALSTFPAACSPSDGEPVPVRVPDESFAPAAWETSWSKEELSTWREGEIRELAPRADPRTEMGGLMEGAKVELIVPSPEGRVTSNDVAGTAVTGPDGRFRVGPGPSQSWILRVSKPGFAPIWIAAGRGLEPRGVVEAIGGPEVRIGLRPAVELAGEVVDESNRPVAGARVVSASVAYREETTTDDAGRFVVHAPGGGTILELDDPRYEVRPVKVDLRIGEPPPKPVVKARTAAPLRGRVVSTGGRPIADAVVVCVEDPSIQTRSGPDGAFEIRISRMQHAAAFTGGYEWHSAAVPRAGELELMLQPARGVSGRVVDAEGRPVADARLTAVVMNYEGIFERVLGPRTGPDGSFRFSWLPLTPRGITTPVRFFARKRGLGESAIVSFDPRGAASEIQLPLLGTRDLTGSATRDDGSPAAGAYVVAKWVHADGGVTGPETACLGVEESVSTHAGADGRWRLDDVPLGLHAKVQCATGSVVLERFVEGEGSAGAFDFVFEGGRAIAGRVVGSDGKPPEGAVHVTAELLNAEGVAARQAVTAGADGAFRFEKMPRGEYQIRAEGERYDLPGGGLASAGDESVVVKLERSASLTVRFSFEDGHAPGVPLAFSLLPVGGGSQQFRQTIPAGGGGEPIVLRGIYPGEWDLALSGDVWRASISHLRLEDGARLDLDVPVRRTLRVAARLLDGDGKPVARQLVVIAPAVPATGAPQTATSGEDGALDLTGLSPGRWVVLCDPPGAPPLRSEFEVKDGANPPLELRLPAHGRIVVHVARDNDTPIADAAIVLTAPDGSPVDAWGEGALILVNRFRTDATGTAKIRGVRAGKVRVEVRSGTELMKTVDVDVAAGRETTVEVP